MTHSLTHTLTHSLMTHLLTHSLTLVVNVGTAAERGSGSETTQGESIASTRLTSTLSDTITGHKLVLKLNSLELQFLLFPFLLFFSLPPSLRSPSFLLPSLLPLSPTPSISIGYIRCVVGHMTHDI